MVVKSFKIAIFESGLPGRESKNSCELFIDRN